MLQKINVQQFNVDYKWIKSMKEQYDGHSMTVE